MTAMSLLGYWRTLSERMACSPAMRITRLTTRARTGRLTKRSVNFKGFASVVFRLGGGLVPRLRLVPHEHGRARAQLEGARSHDLVAGLEPGEDGDLVAARASQLHELLLHALVVLAPGTVEVAHDEHGVSVGRVADRGRGQRDHRLHERAWSQAAAGVGQGRLHFDVAGGLAHHGVNRGDAPRGSGQSL